MSCIVTRNAAAMAALARPTGATVAEIAELIGKPRQQAANRASALVRAGVLHHPGGTTGAPYFTSDEHCEAWRAANTRVSFSERVAQALTHFGAAGARGAQLAEHTGLSIDQCSDAADKLAARGLCQFEHYKGWRIYWPAGVAITDRAEAAHHDAIDRACSRRAVRGGIVRTQSGPIRMSHPTIPEPRRPTGPQGEAITPPGLKPTRGPSFTHDTRYQCAPGESPFGAGFAAVGIGRSPLTGKAWA